jgi:hypothetical protein
MDAGMSRRQPLGHHAVERAAGRIHRCGDEAREQARALGRRQPELVAYLMLATERLSPGARGAAWTGFELASEAMRALARPRVAMSELLATDEANGELTLDLGVAHPRMAERWLRYGAGLRQRALLARLARDVVAAAPRGERGAVFLALKTIVDVLDRPAAGAASDGPAGAR